MLTLTNSNPFPRHKEASMTQTVFARLRFAVGAFLLLAALLAFPANALALIGELDGDIFVPGGPSAVDYSMKE